MLKIDNGHLDAILAFVKEHTGIHLDQSKAYLVESRLGPLVKEFGCSDYAELIAKAKNDPRGRILDKIIDAITTKETFFFRDNAPFELLRHKVLPDTFDRLEEEGRKNLNIWSAACSTGQEPYSVAIILRELLGKDHSSWRIKILATDIYDAAIAQASYGRYNQVEVSRGLSREQLEKYFVREGKSWRIKDEIRADIAFRRMNLLEPFHGLPRFDIILCRNVAIYFPVDDKKKLFEKLAGQLVPRGILFVGASESLLNITDRFERKSYLKSFYYQLKS